MSFEDCAKLIHIAAPRCIAAVFRVTELPHVRIVNSGSCKSLGQRSLRETRSPRLRQFTDVKNVFDTRLS